MNILVVNDDGIFAQGIRLLAYTAKEFGNVFVVAPDSQCSAMSQKLTIFDEMIIRKHSDFPINGVEAYSVSGTPADCVKLAVHVLGIKPDMVFSGINKGYNLGIDIAYSGTVGAAYEALQLGIPSIAFSTSSHSDYEVVNNEISVLTAELINTPISKKELFNVNFPSCSLNDYHGIKRDLPIATVQFYIDKYKTVNNDDGTISVRTDPKHCEIIPEGTDVAFLKANYTTVSRVVNPVL